jgi:hypothetical protein
MVTSSVSVNDSSDAGLLLIDYTSMMLQMYFESLGQPGTAKVLDLGPVCKENITCFAKRIKRLYVCDMFLRLDQNRRKNLPTHKVWDHLDYAPFSFDGINLWDLIDHLDDIEVARLIELCMASLKPGGMIILSSFEEKASLSRINAFVIRNDFRVSFRLQNHLDLPWYYRSNRIITEMLSEFRTVKSFLYRNGVREFFCRR